MASPAHHAATSSLRTEPPRFFFAFAFFFPVAALDKNAFLSPHPARFALNKLELPHQETICPWVLSHNI